ncbi:MAG: hypothetical protein IPM18_07255 [Phycisphaerales bacterium]|nr:hypothetical protein [Phycisphaerales bacterium]
MRLVFTTLAVLVGLSFVTACERSPEQGTVKPAGTAHTAHDTDMATGDEHGQEHAGELSENHDHDHDEVWLGTVTIGDLRVELAQGHGKVEAGKEGHLVVKLPYNDNGATVVRAWIGTEDRTVSRVGKAEYAPSHDDYDVHTLAPDPLPENARWWIEIEKPDGMKVVGSAQLLQ